MPTLSVHGLPPGDAGRHLVRLHHSHRGRTRRFGVARLVNEANGEGLYVLLLGHADPEKIFMPFDIRQALGVDKGGPLTFTIRPVGLWGKLRWYLGSPDPAVHLPAWLAIIGLMLAVLGLALTFPAFLCG
jgi:hypothetical protein